MTIAAFYIENESGASLKGPELFPLLADSRPGDVLLIEQVNRLSRLNAEDWIKLKAEMATRHIRVVALDLPTSWAMADPKADEFTVRMFDVINAMMLDMLGAIARKDYEDRRRRQAEGQAKAEGRYKGRPVNFERNDNIASLLNAGMPWAKVQVITGCSRGQVAKIAKEIAEAA